LLLSTTADLPSGPTIVWVLVALAIVFEVFAHRSMASGKSLAGNQNR